MATYKKRGFKPKNKLEEQKLDEQESTTAEVFSTLDESASKTEEWVSRNQNYILGVHRCYCSVGFRIFGIQSVYSKTKRN